MLLIFLLKGELPPKYRDNYTTEQVNLHDLAERLTAGRARLAAFRAAAEGRDAAVA